MRIIHIVGRQNNGKTTLIVELLAELKKRGLRVGTIKHSSHEHELDVPGKDSFLHRTAGGAPSAVVTQNMMAVYFSRAVSENPLERLKPVFANVDLVLIEGYIDGPGKKIEVWRKVLGTQPVFTERDDIAAVVTDDPLKTHLPVWPRKDVANIAERICTIAGIYRRKRINRYGGSCGMTAKPEYPPDSLPLRFPGFRE